MKIVFSILSVCIAVGYPVILYFALKHGSGKTAGILIMTFVTVGAAIRWRNMDRSRILPLLALPLSIAVVIAAGIFLNSDFFFKLVPSIIGFVIAFQFGISLRKTPLIERFARMQDSNLTPPKIAHCRQFTWIWCGFLLFHSMLCLILALQAPVSIWAAYTGGVFYALMFFLFAIEYIIRKARFREYSKFPWDRALEKLFPRENHADK